MPLRTLRRVDVAASWQHAKAQFAAAIVERNEMLRRHLDELDAVRRELVELRSIFEDVVRCLREQAEADVATLRKRLETCLARLERHPARPLH